MEEEKNSSVSTNSNARWNPTKEQISILENLYKQGVRTPTAEQIQEITGKLREFGSIEGKNVFYWFQNHKARQRQKQKQQTFAYYTRLLKRSPQVLSVPSVVAPMSQPNAVVSPPPIACNGVVIFRPVYAAPQTGGLNFYPQAQAQAQYSAMVNPQSPQMKADTVFPTHNIPLKRHAPSDNGYYQNHASVSDPQDTTVVCETLELFPLRPVNQTFERSEISSRSASLSVSPESSEKADEGEEEIGAEHQFLFDFLGALNG